MKRLQLIETVLEAHQDQPAFWGRGWGFPPSFDYLDGEVSLVEGIIDISQSLLILFSTLTGQRNMEPDFGLDLSRLLFEPMTLELEAEMTEKINYAILIYEPRIELVEVLFNSKELEGILEVHLAYRLRYSNTRTNRVFPFYLGEGTDLNQLNS